VALCHRGILYLTQFTMSGLIFVQSSRGKQLLVIGHSTYYKFRTSVELVTYGCTKRLCTAMVRVAEDEILAEVGIQDTYIHTSYFI
jgi:hypothetical protein